MADLKEVEDLFYNVPTRRRAFRSTSEEYAKILDVVGRYAVHCAGVAFSCKKHGDSGVSISAAANSSTIDRIRQIHGSAVANELIEFGIEDNKKWGFKASGYVTNANYHVKRTVILLFINHRSVESSALRKAIEQTYSSFLPKGGHPFAYVDLEIEPQRVDVNVHPTKREVNFLNEDEIIESICSEIRSKLAQVDSSRTFMTQTLLPGVRISEATASSSTAQSEKAGRRTVTASHKPYENNLVRTDSRMRKITSMLPSAMAQGQSRAEGGDDSTASTDDGMHYETTDREPLRIGLVSVKNLRAAVRAAMHNGLTEMFATHTYVGVVDERRRIAALQAGVKLYLVDYGMICNEFFYQVGLTDFGNFGVIKLDPAPKLIDLLKIAAETEREEDASRRQHHQRGDNDNNNNNNNNNDNSEEDNIFDQAPEMVAKTLIGRRDMLNEYFSLQISEEGDLLSIPLMLKGYVPSLAKLPRFLLRLGPYVDWKSEEGCFRTFLHELAAFYTPEQLPTAPRPRKKNNSDNAEKGKQSSTAVAAAAAAAPSPPTQGEEEEEGSQGPEKEQDEEEEDESITIRRTQLTQMLEYVIFPAIRARLCATAPLLNGVVEVADLKGLYRVFERC
jgi:DNA mismatch repair protein MLH1